MRGGKGSATLPVRVGLIVHPTQGPVLIDAGLGPRITSAPGRSLALRIYARLLGPQISVGQAPQDLLAAHGFKMSDVRLVLLTHLHGDHVGYLRDLPNASVVTDGQSAGLLRHGVFNELLPDDLPTRQRNLRSSETIALPYDLGDGYDILGDGTVLGIPLPGHAPGHYGLMFPGERPLIYAADAQWLIAAMAEGKAPGFPASLVASSKAHWVETTRRLCDFMAEGGEVVLCHDPNPTAYDWTPNA